MPRYFILVCCDEPTFNEQCRITKESELINYTEVFARLENNDVYNEKPSEEIVKMMVIRILYDSIYEESIKEIYYRISSLDKKTINSILNFVKLTKKNFNFILYSHIPVENSIRILFDKVKII